MGGERSDNRLEKKHGRELGSKIAQEALPVDSDRIAQIAWTVRERGSKGFAEYLLAKQYSRGRQIAAHLGRLVDVGSSAIVKGRKYLAE